MLFFTQRKHELCRFFVFAVFLYLFPSIATFYPLVQSIFFVLPFPFFGSTFMYFVLRTILLSSVGVPSYRPAALFQPGGVLAADSRPRGRFVKTFFCGQLSPVFPRRPHKPFAGVAETAARLQASSLSFLHPINLSPWFCGQSTLYSPLMEHFQMPLIKHLIKRPPEPLISTRKPIGLQSPTPSWLIVQSFKTYPIPGN